MVGAVRGEANHAPKMGLREGKDDRVAANLLLPHQVGQLGGCGIDASDLKENPFNHVSETVITSTIYHQITVQTNNTAAMNSLSGTIGKLGSFAIRLSSP